jgi:hypothetical protein
LALGLIVATANAGRGQEDSTVPQRSAGGAPAEVQPAAGSQSQAAEKAPPIDPQELADLVRRLDDDRFAIRESAQQQLLARGAGALAAVGQAAAGGSLESSTRAVGILLYWAKSDDPSLSLGALEHLAGLTNRPAESAMASDRLADVREAAAIKALVDLGGRIVEPDPQVAILMGPKPPVQVVIGPEWKGGIEGLSHLADVRRAATISFHSAPIGVTALPRLRKLTQVRRIEFYSDSPEISPEAVAFLPKRLPQATIEVRSGARLGISGLQSVAGGAQVQMVQAGSAAETAGLKPGDVITEISGVAVANFEALTQEIAKASAGDSVVLKVVRQGQGEPMDVTVTFDRWGDEPPPQPAGAMAGAIQPFGALPLGRPQPVIIQNRR